MTSTNYSNESQNKADIWKICADNLHISAGILWLAMKDENKSIFISQLGLDKNINLNSACQKNYCMLLGLSFELIIKAIIAAKNNIEKIPETHALIDIVKNININLTDKDLKILRLLSDYIVWAGKYPSPKKNYQLEDYKKIFMDTLVEISINGNTTTYKYNNSLDWENVNSIWVIFSNEYNSIT